MRSRTQGAAVAAVGRGVKVVSAAMDRLRPPPPGLVVLCYHRVGGATDVAVDLGLATFDRQMAELAESGRLVTLDRGIDLLEGQGPAWSGPDLPVVVTFDDGTADFVDTALSVLVDHQVPATVYVATRFVDEQRWFPDRGRPATWAGLVDAASTGLVTVGSHTHSHRLLDRVDAERAAEELDRSVGLIEDHVQSPVAHFAYPKALGASGPVAHEVARRFRSAAVAGGGTNPWVAPRVHQLARTPVQRSDGPRFFRAKSRGGLGWEGRLRDTRSVRRYRTAET